MLLVNQKRNGALPLEAKKAFLQVKKSGRRSISSIFLPKPDRNNLYKGCRIWKQSACNFLVPFIQCRTKRRYGWQGLETRYGNRSRSRRRSTIDVRQING